MSTLREHLERIRDRHRQTTVYDKSNQGYAMCGRCVNQRWPCPDFEDAVAALAQLKAPDQREKCPMCQQPCDLVRVDHSHERPLPLSPFDLPDPLVPRLDANPNTKEDA